VDPLTPQDLRSGVVHAQATDLLTGKSEELVTKPRSICHFFEPFVSGGYDVRLRLDWKDRDSQGNPRLDADFYDLTTGKMAKSMRAHEAHHTTAALDDQGRTYAWDFGSDSRSMRVTLTWSVAATCEVRVTATCDVQVIRAGDRAQGHSC
jgi:hypothetical protein